VKGDLNQAFISLDFVSHMLVVLIVVLGFFAAHAMHKRGYSRHVVSVRPSVCYVRVSCQNE